MSSESWTCSQEDRLLAGTPIPTSFSNPISGKILPTVEETDNKPGEPLPGTLFSTFESHPSVSKSQIMRELRAAKGILKKATEAAKKR